MSFTWGQSHSKRSWSHFVTGVWRLHLWPNHHISKGPMIWSIQTLNLNSLPQKIIAVIWETKVKPYWSVWHYLTYRWIILLPAWWFTSACSVTSVYLDIYIYIIYIYMCVCVCMCVSAYKWGFPVVWCMVVIKDRFSLLFVISSGCARPITEQVTSVTWPAIGCVKSELTPSKRQKTGPGFDNGLLV